MIPVVTASEMGEAHPESLWVKSLCGVVGFRWDLAGYLFD